MEKKRAIVSTAKQLIPFLENKSKDFLFYEPENPEFIKGTYKGENIAIELIDAHWLIVSISPKGKSYLQELEPIFTEIMAGNKAICEYDYVSKRGKKDNEESPVIDHTIEWEIENPDSRMTEITTGRAYSDTSYRAVNLIEYYETSLRKMTRLGINSFSPILFKGNIGTEELSKSFAKCTEAELYLILLTMSRIHTVQWRGYWPDPVSLETNWCEVINIVATNYLKDLQQNISIYDIKKTPQYRDWWNEWSACFTFERQCEYMERRINGEDVSMFVPEKGFTKQYD